MEEEPPDSGDALFGHNVRKLRERAGLSQPGLADAMRERGHPWHQSTVYRVESGKQPVGYWAARDLAEILRTSTDSFAWKPAEANAADHLYMEAGRVRGSARDLMHAVGAMLAARGIAGRVLENTAKYDSARLHDARAEVEDALSTYELVDVINEGIRQYEDMREGDGEGEGEGDDGDAQGEPRVDDQRGA